MLLINRYWIGLISAIIELNFHNHKYAFLTIEWTEGTGWFLCAVVRTQSYSCYDDKDTTQRYTTQSYGDCHQVVEVSWITLIHQKLSLGCSAGLRAKLMLCISLLDQQEWVPQSVEVKLSYPFLLSANLTTLMQACSFSRLFTFNEYQLYACLSLWLFLRVNPQIQLLPTTTNVITYFNR